MLKGRQVTVAAGGSAAEYPGEAPFRPDASFPELSGRVAPGTERNGAYRLVRELLVAMELDAERFGSDRWSPLGSLIRPGQKVVIKPNLVRHRHIGGGDYRAVVTNASIVRAVADYVALALQGSGEIVIGDAPVQGTDFAALVERTGLDRVRDDVAECWGLPVRLADFRLWALHDEGAGFSESGDRLQGDRDGYCEVDLGERSMLAPLEEQSDRFRVSMYDPDHMRRHHCAERHEYLIAKAVLSADVVINLPKLKTHRKVGMTAALKNLVGINGHKDWLPHHRLGSPGECGDEYPHRSWLKRTRTALEEGIYRRPGSSANPLRRFGMRLAGRLIRDFARDDILDGSWPGNDTCWRMVADLNRALLYADTQGRMTDSVQRTTLTIVDAIVAGEGEGPMRPDARPCNLLVGGENPLAVDAALATLIGFDYRKLALIARSFEIGTWPLAEFAPAEVEVRSTDPRFDRLSVGAPHAAFRFRAPASWSGAVELDGASEVDCSRSQSAFAATDESVSTRTERSHPGGPG
jgi:uncharacterized protein (DUF362 family)